jgi:autotransporter-associated beta strand protein
MKKLFGQLLVLSIISLLALQLQAAQVTWTGASLVNGNLDNADNTSGATIGAADEVIFNAAIANGWGTPAAPVLVTNTLALQYLTFTGAAGDYVIGATASGTLMFTQNNSYVRIDNNYAGSGTMTVAAPIYSSGQNIYLQNNSANGTLVIKGDIYSSNSRPFLRLEGSNTNANTISGNITRTAIVTSGTGSTWNLTGSINSAGLSEAAYLDSGILNVSGTWNVANTNSMKTRYNQGSVAGTSGTLVIKDNGYIYGFAANNQFESGAVILEGNAIMQTNNNTLAFGKAGTTFNLTVKDNAQLNMLGTYGGRFVIDGEANTILTVNQTGGAVKSTAGIAIGERRTTTSTGTAVYNLNGGTLTVGDGQVYSNLRGGVNVLNNASFVFNGGTLSASANTALRNDNTQDTGNPTFATLTNGRFVVSNGGAKINTNGFVVTASTALQHDAVMGANRDGGLTKTGAGTLILNAVNTYTGDTVISAGVVSVGTSTNRIGSLGLGNVQLAQSGATLLLYNATAMDSGAILQISSGGDSAISLLYDGTMVISDIYDATTGTHLNLAAGTYDVDALNLALGGVSIFSGLADAYIQISAIPEPSAWLLLASGMTLITGLQWRRRSRLG